MSDPRSTDDVIQALLLALEAAAREGDTQRVDALQRAIAVATDNLRARETVRMQERMSEAARDLRSRAVQHRARMEKYRYGIATALIVVLFGVILAGIKFGGGDGDNVAQYAAPVSGLAGIAIGWLFGGRDQERDSLDVLPAFPPVVSEPPPVQPGIYIGGSNFGAYVGIEPRNTGDGRDPDPDTPGDDPSGHRLL